MLISGLVLPFAHQNTFETQSIGEINTTSLEFSFTRQHYFSVFLVVEIAEGVLLF
jgi:hypothetical protein